MEGATLFNSGFLGANFLWWVGQIADDSTWRDNILPGKYEDQNMIPGWGRRYKVRIIGLHDQDESPISSDQLPWAQIMYPVTAGGGQTNASQTANLRQGMFVFGFFLDGSDQQVPVIMGVLGNNPQTVLNYQTGMSGGKNFTPQSGYAQNVQPKSGSSKEIVPDSGLTTKKPKSPSQQLECAPPPPGVKVNKYGLRPDLPRTKDQDVDLQDAVRKADDPNRPGGPLTGDARANFITQEVADGIKRRCSFTDSPQSESQPGATLESTGGEHQLNAGQVKRDKKYLEKIPLVKPDKNFVESSVKAIQTAIDNLTQKIDQYLNAATSYIDAVSGIIGDIKKVISGTACEIAKYMKVIFDKIMEYVLKIMNKNMTKTVSSIPSSQRYKFADMKDSFTESILCLYKKITDKLCEMIQGILDELINLDQLEDEVKNRDPKKVVTPKVSICSAENIIGRVIGNSRSEIDKVNNSIIDNVNTFIEDVESQITQVKGIATQASTAAAQVSAVASQVSSVASQAGSIASGISGTLGSIGGAIKIGNISGSITSALQFENIISNVFKCEDKMNPAVSDYYTFDRGGSSQSQGQLPSMSAINKATSLAKSISSKGGVPFHTPSKGSLDVILRKL